MGKEMTNRQKNALETRRKILEAAKKVVSEKGFENVSVEDMAKAAGVATGSFYTYFKRKEDVIQELNKTDFYRLAEIVNQMTGKDIHEKLEYYCREFMKSIERAGIEICRQWIRNNVAAIPMCGETDITKYQYDYQAMQSVLNEAVGQGQLKAGTPINELALYINSQLYGLMNGWVMSDGAVVGSEAIDGFCRLMLDKSIEEYRI